MESYEQCEQGRSYCSLCTLDTIHRLVFVTRLIINKINKVRWVDFKLENVLVSLHSLKTTGLPLFLRNGELLGHSSILKTNQDILMKFYKCYDFWAAVRIHVPGNMTVCSEFMINIHVYSFVLSYVYIIQVHASVNYVVCLHTCISVN